MQSPRRCQPPATTSTQGPPTPAKPIDLNSSTATTDRATLTKVTRRAFLIDVVVDNTSTSEETSSLLVDLGNPLSYPLSTQSEGSGTPSRPSTPDPSAGSSAAWTAEKHAQAKEQLRFLRDELLKTERSYVQRVRALKSSYADPLRRFAKSPATQIIPSYEAKTLFANIEAIVPAAVAFLSDLESMSARGWSVGDVCLRHFKDLKTFDCYRAYYSQQDESHKTFHDCVRKHSSFNSFIESTKYQTTGMNNIGLRELLMEPVQRLPRYTLFWQSMLKCLHPTDPERLKIDEAMAIASRIAKCEADVHTTRATIMYCLGRTIDGLPADIISNSRDYVDSLDVDDIPVEQFHGSTRPTSPQGRALSPSRPMSIMSTSTSTSSHQSIAIASPGGPSSVATLHCTLFLFDDKLVITKRPHRDISGRKATGLDDLQKLVKTGGGVAVYDRDKEKRDKLGYRGAVDVLDVIATDIGGGDFHLFLERPPIDQSDRWNARPLRSYTTVHPPYNLSLHPVTARKDKLRFVRNLWAAQALARTRLRKRASDLAVPRVLKSREEIKLATCYWNVWERAGWMTCPSKAKVVVVIDESGDSASLSLGTNGSPLVVIRLQPMDGGVCRFALMSGAGEDVGERAVIETSNVIEHIVSIIHQLGVFKFRTSNSSCPTTPSNTQHRLRPTMLNLDAISRNLFGTSTSSGSDVFGTTSSKRTKSSAMSRTSTSDGSTTDGLMASAKKLSHRPKSTSSLEARSSPYQSGNVEKSERDLNERLDLARRNSRSVASREGVFKLEPAVHIDGDVIEEEREIQAEAEAQLLRALSRNESPSLPRHTSPLRVVNRTPSPTRPPPVAAAKSPTAPLVFSPKSKASAVLLRASVPTTDIATSRTASPPLSPKPLGPRSLPSLSKTVLSPPLGSTHTKLRIVSGTRRASGNPSVKSDDSRRAPSPPTLLSATKRQHSMDPFAPRKRSPSGSPMQKEALSPLVAPPQARANSKRTPSRPVRKSSVVTPKKAAPTEDVEMIEHTTPAAALGSVRNRISASRKAVKLLRSEVETMQSRLGREPSFKDRLQRIEGNGSMPRSPQTRNIRRHADVDDLGRPIVEHASVSSRNSIYSKMEVDSVSDSLTSGISTIVQQLDRQLRKAIADSDQALEWAAKTSDENQTQRVEIERLNGQLARSKRHQELVEGHLVEVQGEVDIIYEAFNEELDGMFNDANLPETEAFTAMRRDLQLTKASRNELALENMKLKRDLEESNLKREEWAIILRTRGVLS